MSAFKGENKTSPIKFVVDVKGTQINSTVIHLSFGHDSFDSLVLLTFLKNSQTQVNNLNQSVESFME